MMTCGLEDHEFEELDQWQRERLISHSEGMYALGRHHGIEESRIAVLGAIRRAAAVARSWDYCILDSCACHTNAEQIRIAIRAAIGSENI